MKKTYKTLALATLMSCGLAGYAVSGIVIASEPWDAPGDTRGFSLANEIGASGAVLSVPVGVGNPVSSLNTTADTSGDFGLNVDRISATGGAAAPFIGAYNVDKPENIAFDFAQTVEPAGLQFFFVANGVEWFYDIDTSGFASTGWNNQILVSMSDDAGWTDFGTSDFLTDLAAGVTEIGFRVTYLTDTAGQNYGFDNLSRIYNTPEPETYAALSFALICLGITFRRRLQDSMNGALAALKS